MLGRTNDPRYGRARKGDGAKRWCKRCGRIHPSQVACTLLRVTRIAKSGKKTTRFAHIGRADG